MLWGPGPPKTKTCKLGDKDRREDSHGGRETSFPEAQKQHLRPSGFPGLGSRKRAERQEKRQGAALPFFGAGKAGLADT